MYIFVFMYQLKMDLVERGGAHFVIPALKRQRQEDHKFEPSLSYIVRPYLKKN
jgi:hypothetical protein